MGNSPENATRRTRLINPNKSKFSKNSYSLDQNSMFSQYMEKADKDASSVKAREPSIALSSPILLDNIAKLSKPQNNSIDGPFKSTEFSPQSIMKKSQSLTINKSKIVQKMQNDNRLFKLNQKNDELRKELIRISSELTSQLKNKKYQEKKKEVQVQQSNQDVQVLNAVRRQLENGYKEIARLKKYIENLKKSEGNARNEDLMNEIEAKINNVQFDISEIMFQIQNAKELNKGEQLELQQNVGVADLKELIPFKKEIQKLRIVSKRLYKGERARLQKQKVMQQIMFQLQRRKRQIFGQYLPEIKSYANKNYQPDPKVEKKKDEFANYKPAAWEIRSLEQERKSLKEKHEEYHLKMDRALKAKNNIKDQSEKLKKQLDIAAQKLQVLAYKKQRYLQLVMGNLQFLMNGQSPESDEDEDESSSPRSVSFKVVTKGNDVPDQKPFDDHNVMKDMNSARIKIVSVNIWYTSKHQISALQFIYSYGTQCFLGNKTSNVTGDMEKEVLELEEGDYIKNLMGISSRKGAIEFLAFYSAKGKAKQFGKQMVNGLNFALGLTKRQRPVCMAGFTFYDGNYWRINKLAVDVAAES